MKNLLTFLMENSITCYLTKLINKSIYESENKTTHFHYVDFILAVNGWIGRCLTQLRISEACTLWLSEYCSKSALEFYLIQSCQEELEEQ